MTSKIDVIAMLYFRFASTFCIFIVTGREQK